MILLLAAIAFAQDDDARARELFENGSGLYEEGQYDNAIAAWKEAYRLSARPLILYNIANALERAGRLDETRDTLNQYRAFATADERNALEQRIKNLERRISEEAASAPVEAPPEETTAVDPTPVEVLTTPIEGGTSAETPKEATVVAPPRKRRTGAWTATVSSAVVGAGGATLLTLGYVRGSQGRSTATGLCAPTSDGLTLCPEDASGGLEQSASGNTWIAAGTTLAVLGAAGFGVSFWAASRPYALDVGVGRLGVSGAF